MRPVPNAIGKGGRSTYLGLAEVAELLGITVTTAGMRRSRNQLPKPIAELKMGPLWRLSQFKNLPTLEVPDGQNPERPDPLRDPSERG